ncbi:hypothetical protein BDB00DRAFT_971465 [Zychaea mexicana]|uniref:uncharacterized protein n=1 Tax=Zychaea mexicana TaxID=64656 RepID=UPI0022FE06F3|nr:uncharacterized protein BDB00DRAFT_971465 [Zychaea mexicana]KAI9496422.1 hypothetical protein BDB00DRAFT_971465 [Zychaea mexicana]
MGYATLDAALAFPNNVPPTKSHIVITDTLKSNGNFLIHHFVGNHLKADRHVILIGLSQIFNHYFLIGRKLGINLQAYKQSGHFSFVDGLTHINPYTQGSPYPPKGTPSTPTDTLDGSSQPSNTNVLLSFYQVIRRHILQSKTHPLLILDDASVLLITGYGLDSVCQFLHKLKVLMASVGGTLITVVHADEEGADDTEQDAFVKSVVANSELILQAEALGSGLARDIHGQLSILHGPQYVPKSTVTAAQELHYKILDNNAEFFAKGISQV